MAADDSQWKTPHFRQSVVAKIDEAIQVSGMPTSKNSIEMENHVFQKAKSKEEYLGFVARLILHVREMNSKKGATGNASGTAGTNNQGMPDPIGALQTLARQGTGNNQMMGMGGPGANHQGIIPQPPANTATNRADEVFHSSWPYFDYMTLLDKDKSRETLNTITTEKEASIQNPAETVDKIIVDCAEEAAMTQTVHKVAKPPTNKKMKKNDHDEKRLEKAFSILEVSAAGKKEETEFQIFGNYIGKKLEKYSPATRNAVQQGIMAIIFNADTGFYEKPFSSTQPPGYFLHPHYSQPQNSFTLNQNNHAQQFEHLQASVSCSFSSDTNTTSSTYTCNQGLQPDRNRNRNRNRKRSKSKRLRSSLPVTRPKPKPKIGYNL